MEPSVSQTFSQYLVCNLLLQTVVAAGAGWVFSKSIQVAPVTCVKGVGANWFNK